jgi:hypothetical protein
MISEKVKLATLLYVTNRGRFNELYGDTPHKDYLDMLFIGASTRYELSETIAVIIAGFTYNDNKHGIDGHPSNHQSGYGEFKVTTTDTQRTSKSSIGSVTINDPSQKIVDKYDEVGDNLVFVFPLFIDGHLISMFSVRWDEIRYMYVDGIQKINNKNKNKKSGSSAARNFTLSASKWLDCAECMFLNDDNETIIDVLNNVKILVAYKKRIIKEMQNRKK